MSGGREGVGHGGQLQQSWRHWPRRRRRRQAAPAQGQADSRRKSAIERSPARHPRGQLRTMTALQAIILAIVQGDHRALPDLQPGACGDRAGAAGLEERRREFRQLPAVPGGDAPRHRAGAARLLLAHWFDFATAILFRRGPKAEGERRIFWRVVVATIPAVIVGFFLEKELKRAFGAPVLAAGFLIANGVMLFAAERLQGPPGPAADAAALDRRRRHRAVAMPGVHPRLLALRRHHGRRLPGRPRTTRTPRASRSSPRRRSSWPRRCWRRRS